MHEALADFNARPSSGHHSLAEHESRLLDLFNRAWQRLEPEMDAAGISQHEQRTLSGRKHHYVAQLAA